MATVPFIGGVGLLFGWFCFIMFFAGTISFYRTELKLWSKPEAHVTSHQANEITQALNYLSLHGKEAESWTLKLPNHRDSGLIVQWTEKKEALSNSHQKHGNEVRLDPRTGQKIVARETSLFDMIFRLHFKLYGLPKPLGKIIMGTAALGMLIALITGVIIHRHFFKDLFTFRPKKGMRSWLDLHVVASVLALPFHIVLTYSGLMLFMFMLMPWGVNVVLDGEQTTMRNIVAEKSEYIMAENNALHLNTELLLADALTDLIAQGGVQQQWSEGVQSIVLNQPQSRYPEVVITEQGAYSLLNEARADRWHFSTQSGELIKIERSKIPESIAAQVYNAALAVHLQSHAQPLQRALFFIAGLFATLMIATGLHIWSKKRPSNSSMHIGKRIGLTLVTGLNVGVIVGLPCAIAFAMWLNRTLPFELVHRAGSEIDGLFIFWMLTFLWGWIRPYQKALIELSSVCAVLLFTLFTYNLFLLYPSVGLQQQGWLGAPLTMQMIDISILFSALCISFFAYRNYQILRTQNNASKANTQKLEESLC